jgi:hypothetical protein
MLNFARLLVIGLLISLGAISIYGQSAAPAPTLSQQEESIRRQMQALTSAGAQQQSESINAQAESLRHQYGTSTGNWSNTPIPPPAAPSATPANTKPADPKPIEDPKPVSTDPKPAQDGSQSQGFYTVPWPASPDFVMPNVQVATTACNALPSSEVDTLVKDASARNSLDATLLRAVMVQESGFRPCAVSTAGAMGLMQIMPETADDLGLTDPFDPAANVNAGAKYLKQMLDHYHGDKALALAAYNAGPGRTDKANGGIPQIPETIGYVASILSNIPLF